MKTLLLSLITLSFISCSTPPDVVTESREPSSFKSCLDIMSEMMEYKPFYGEAKEVFSKVKSLRSLEAAYGGESLLDIQRNTPNAEILANNANVRKLLRAKFEPKPMQGKISAVPTKDANVIYKAMENSEVNVKHDCYDTKGTIGFCFGRATIAHMEAIVREVHPDSVKKIWIAGDMGQWGHHVATMVNTEKGWMILDTNNGRPLTPDEWIDCYMKEKAAKADKDIMVFITQAGRFGPYDNRAYSAVDLFNTNTEEYNRATDYFNGYFHDYFNSLDNFKNKPFKDQPKK